MGITPNPAPVPEPAKGGATAIIEPLASTLPPEPEPVTTATSQPDGPTPEELAAKEAEAKAAEAVKAKELPKRDYAAERTQERINKLTAQKAELEREVAKLKSGQSADATAMQAEIAEKAAKLAQEEAGKIAAWNTFTGNLNSAIAEGQKEFGAEKFDASVAALRALHDQTDPDVAAKYLSMLQAVLDTGAAPKLIAALGEDPDEAARILSLTPTKMGVELGKLAFRDAEGVSGAPKPVTPITGVGRTHVAIAAEDPERSDSIDMRVWMERRGQHVAEVNKRAGRRVIP
jgi:cell division protein FtsB